VPQFAQQRNGLQPAEAFFDALPLLLAEGIARLSRGAAVDGTAASSSGVLQYVRCHAQVATLAHEFRGVVAIVAAHGHTPPSRNGLQHIGNHLEYSGLAATRIGKSGSLSFQLTPALSTGIVEHFTICKDVSVRIITKKRIKEASREHPEWKASLESWHKITKAADWKNFPEVKQSWRNVDLVGICVVFDIANNRARLVAHVDYKYHMVFIRFIIGHVGYLKGGWKHDCNC
jgi:mRNA interferase HigB